MTWMATGSPIPRRTPAVHQLKIARTENVSVYGTVPATGKCQVLRSVPYSPFVEHPGWTGLDAQVLRGDTVAALDWINRNRVDLNKAKVGCTFGGR